MSGNAFAIILGQGRFWVPGVNMGRCALREDVHHMFGPGRKMRGAWEQARSLVNRERLRAKKLLTEQRGQAESSKAHSRSLKKLSAGKEVVVQSGRMLASELVFAAHNQTY